MSEPLRRHATFAIWSPIRTWIADTLRWRQGPTTFNCQANHHLRGQFCQFRVSLLHSVWKSPKKSHSTLRAKRATFTFRLTKKYLKMPKIVNFGKFLKKWSLRSNSVIKQKMPRQANKHSSLRSQNCEMRLFEWLFQQHRAQQGLCKFREVNKYTWQRQKQLKQREGKKWRRQWIDYALVSPMQFVKLHLTIDHFLPGNLFSLLMEEMKHQHCYFCTFPHCLKTT